MEVHIELHLLRKVQYITFPEDPRCEEMMDPEMLNQEEAVVEDIDGKTYQIDAGMLETNWLSC